MSPIQDFPIDWLNEAKSPGGLGTSQEKHQGRKQARAMIPMALVSRQVCPGTVTHLKFLIIPEACLKSVELGSSALALKAAFPVSPSSSSVFAVLVSPAAQGPKAPQKTQSNQKWEAQTPPASMSHGCLFILLFTKHVSQSFIVFTEGYCNLCYCFTGGKIRHRKASVFPKGTNKEGRDHSHPQYFCCLLAWGVHVQEKVCLLPALGSKPRLSQGSC